MLLPHRAVRGRHLHDYDIRHPRPELANAIADVLAALLRSIGFVGRPRRRAAIRADLDLLRELGKFPEFAAGSRPHRWLTSHITTEVAELSGVDLRTSRRKIAWSSVVVAACIWAALGWLTYHLVDIGHPWCSVISAIPAGVFFVAMIGLLTEKEELIPPDDGTGSESSAPSGPTT